MNHKKTSATSNKKLFSSFKKNNTTQQKPTCPIGRSHSISTEKSTKSKSIYRRLSNALSLKTTKSNDSTEDVMSIPTSSPSSPRNSIASVTTAATATSSTMIDSTTLMDAGNLDDDYLLNNNRLNNFKNFSGTSQVNLHFGYISDAEDTESISSSESSILNDATSGSTDEDEVKVFNQNYIYNPNYDGAFFDYEDDECNDNEMVDAEREKERRELRLQILKELY
jgi:hypothetical protein